MGTPAGQQKRRSSTRQLIIPSSSADWTFPSPSATPTSATHNNNPAVCQTPKTSSFPTHFQDAFNTPQMQGFATPTQPEHATMTQMQRPQMSTEDLKASYFANVHASEGQVPVQEQYMSMPQSGILPASTAAHTLPKNAHSMPPQAATTYSFDSAHMQTPPPTRGTSAKNVPSQPVAFGTPSTIASRRFLSPQQQAVIHHSSSGAQRTPTQLPHFQIPPEAFQYQDVGPASAPVFPQSQILWTSPNPYQHSTPLADPFDPYMSGGMLWPSSIPLASNVHTATFETPAMKSFATQGSHPRLAAPIEVAPSSFTSGSVNPSLVYSSPVRPAERTKAATTRARTHASHEDLRPKPKATTDHVRSETVSSINSSNSASSRGLRRNNTTGTADLTKAQASLRGQEVSSRNIGLQIQRTASPQKRVGRSALGPISEIKALRSRKSVVLTIDENGNARTETRQVDESPTTALREKYPGLYDYDSSDAETETSEPMLSRNSSFSFAPGEERRSKAARLDAPLENLVGLSIPRTSSAASNKVSPSRAAIAAVAQLRRDRSTRKKTPSKRRPGVSATTSFDASAMEIGSAPNFTASGSRARHLSTATSFEHLQQSQSSMSSDRPLLSFEVSRSRQSSFLERLVRCSCGASIDNGQPLVQCYQCTKWLHPGCAGFPLDALPLKFICAFCTASASSIRAGKVRNR